MTITDDKGISAEVKQLVDQTARLARLELELAKAEFAGKAGSLRKGAAALLAAALLGLVSLFVLTAAAILALATAMAGWLAALIVFAALVAAGGALALLGRRAFTRVTPLVPERAIDSLKGDLKWFETQLKSAER